MALANVPSMGVNLSFDPFGQAAPRRRQVQEDELPRNYGTGFSPDGLSYAVADDFAKLRGDALARFEAAMDAERRNRLSIDSRGIVDAKPIDANTAQGIYQSTIAPVETLFGREGSGYRPSSPILREAGSDTFERDPVTGQWVKVLEGPKKAVTEEEFKGPITEKSALHPQVFDTKTARQWERDIRLGIIPPSLGTNQPLSTYAEFGRQSNAVPSSALSPESAGRTNVTRRLRFNPTTQKLE